jgi:hypothetical protein
MPDLSPAAQAVLHGFRAVPTLMDGPSIAGALRAAADQVVPPHLETELYDRNPSLTLQKAVEIREAILAIADELEGAK